MEADNIDPQQRDGPGAHLGEALENARIPASSLRGESVGVFVGSSTNDYSYLAMMDPAHGAPVRHHRHRQFDHRQPGVLLLRFPRTVGGRRHGLLVIVGRSAPGAGAAVRRGRRGGGRRRECPVTPAVTLGFDEVGGCSRRTAGSSRFLRRRRVRPFRGRRHARACCLDDARRDGDEITVVIAGSAVNHDGRSNGMLAPNPDAQAEVLRKAYRDAGINPRTVDYIEAHGTGTILGDPIEAGRAGPVVGCGRAADKPALLGAVKSNLGHLESAAGAASLAKVALSLHNNKIPPVDQLRRSQSLHRFRRRAPQGRRHCHRVAPVQRACDRRCLGVRVWRANAHLVLREVLPEDLPSPSRT